MFKGKNPVNIFKWELRCMARRLPLIIIGVAVSLILLLYGWSVFGGPCRVSLFFKIPGGGITIGAYYVLWTIMFLTFGAEAVIIATQRRHLGTGNLFLCHLCAHLCLFLWYPLFFTTLSQILAFGVIAAATVIFFLELKPAKCTSELLFFICILKGIISGIYTYISLAFLLIN